MSTIRRCPRRCTTRQVINAAVMDNKGMVMASQARPEFESSDVDMVTVGFLWKAWGFYDYRKHREDE